MTQTPALAHDLGRLRAAYQEKLPGEIRKLRSLWDKLLLVKWNEQAFELFHRMVHNLAGSAGTHGFAEVSRLAAGIEQILQALEGQHNLPGEHERARINGSLQRLESMLDTGVKLEMVEMDQPLTPPAERGVTHPTRVLILEDDADNATLLRTHLEHHGCQVDIADSATALQQAIATQVPDVLLVDIMLPDGPMAGIDAVAGVRSEHGLEIPVLFMSARADLEARLAAVRAGGSGYFVKPLDISALLRKIDALKDDGERCYRVLVVDDDPNMAAMHALLLRKAGLVVEELTQPKQILQVLHAFRPDLILMDLYMPDCPGGELTQVIRQDSFFSEIPILFVSGEADAERQNTALGQGGDAFLLKPVGDRQLVQAVSSRVRRARALNQRLQRLSERDPQTGFINQHALLSRLETTLDELAGAEMSASLLFIEINEFRPLRSRLKFGSLDLLVASVAATVRSEIGPTEQIARIGSASFVVLLSGVSPHTALAVSDRIRQAIAGKIYPADVQSMAVTASIGVAPLHDSYVNADDWLSGAAIACDIACKNGNNQSYLHSPHSDHQPAREQNEQCARLLRSALNTDRLRCVYQPIASLHGDTQEKYDVLVRMDDPTGREILPARFLPVAAQEKLCGDVDRWVTRHSVRTLAGRHREGHQTIFFIKLSAMTLVDLEFVPWLEKLLTSERLPAAALVFQFAEKTVATRLKEAGMFFRELHRLGCGTALEHFGAQLDSNQLLNHLHADYIKVDGGFVQGLERNRANQESIRHLLDPANRRHVKVIASFIEDAASLGILYQCGVQYIQGNFLQEPQRLMSFSFGDEPL